MKPDRAMRLRHKNNVTKTATASTLQVLAVATAIIAALWLLSTVQQIPAQRTDLPTAGELGLIQQ